MIAWLFTGANRPLERIERPTPEPGPGEVLVAVRGSGLCHSDVGRMDGTLTPFMPVPPPIVLGHEIAGEIVTVGPGVAEWRAGDRVVASGTVAFCPGRQCDGGYATHCLLPVHCLIRLPDSVSYVQGAAATDAGQTSHAALVGAGELQAGHKLGIVGLGGLGMTAARIGVLLGAEVHAAEPRHEAWEPARAQGVASVVAGVRELAPLGLDLIVDFAGFGETTAGAIEAVRAYGRVVQVGLGRTEATISTMALIGRNVTLRGSGGGTKADTQAVINMMAQGLLTIAATPIGFDAIPAGLERLARGGVVGRIVAAM
ncbi:MAG: zinc-binding dehydrogenase [Sphingomonadales bacterium]|nr:zinc-binding dehydrogenase [Sphingomonadales bacterium]